MLSMEVSSPRTRSTTAPTVQQAWSLPKKRCFITSEHPCLWSLCTPFSAQPFPLLRVFLMPAVPASEGHHLSEKWNFSIILRPLPTYRWAQELQGLALFPSPGWVPLMLRLSRSGNTFLDSLPLKQTPAQLSCCIPAAPGQSHPAGGSETSLTRLINAMHPMGSAGIPWWIHPGHRQRDPQPGATEKQSPAGGCYHVNNQRELMTGGN